MADPWRPGEPPPAPPAGKLWLAVFVAAVMLSSAGMTVKGAACVWSDRGCDVPAVHLPWNEPGSGG